MLSAVVLWPLMEAAHVFIYSTAPPVSRKDLRQQGRLSTDTPQILVTVPEPGGALLRALARLNQQKRVGQRWLCTVGKGRATVVSFGGVSRERQRLVPEAFGLTLWPVSERGLSAATSSAVFSPFISAAPLLG